MHIDYPFAIDERGRTALVPDEKYVRDLIEQTLFTSPGERVNRPDFGAGLNARVFEWNSPEQAGAVEYAVQSALERYLGSLLQVDELRVTPDDAILRIEVAYRLVRTQERRAVTVERNRP